MAAQHPRPLQGPVWYRATKAWLEADTARVRPQRLPVARVRTPKPPQVPPPQRPAKIGQPWTCQRCGHQWFGRQPHAPRRCPSCQSPYWQTPRRQPLLGRRRRQATPTAVLTLVLGLTLPDEASMPLQGGQWQWPLEETWGSIA